MAKRGPGRPKSAAAADDPVGILNGEVPPRSNITRFPQKRAREAEKETPPTSKRRATARPAARPTEEAPEYRKSTRLSHPQSSTPQQRSGDTGQRQSHDLYEVLPASPAQPLRTTAARERVGKFKPVRDEDNGVSGGEEGEEGAANPLMTSPASNTRNHAKKRGMTEQTKDGKDAVVDVQPIKRGQRPQRLLTNKTKPRKNALLKPQPVPSGTTQKSSARQNFREEEATLATGISGQHDVPDREQASTNEVHQEHQDRSSPAEEPVNSTENESVDGQHGETAQLPDMEEAFKRASSLYKCNKSWETMLKAAQENLDMDDRGNQAVKIKGLVGLIKIAKLVYRKIRIRSEGNLEDKEFEIVEQLGDIDNRIRTIRPTKNKKTDGRLFRGVYLQGIPKMVKLLKIALVTRSLSGELSITSLKELIRIINSTINLCEKAYHWDPRPALETGVKKRTSSEIKLSLEALRNAYTEAQYDQPDDEEVEARKIAKRQKLANQVADFLAQEQEREERAEHNERAISRDRNRPRRSGVSLLADVFDVNDLGLNAASPAPAPNGMRRGLPWRGTGVAGARQSLPSKSSPRRAARGIARKSRERTEDIPGPMAPDWSRRENRALLEGLEVFTGANRYLEIDQLYGSADGPLSGRDVDALMQRARFYKQTMASQIEEERTKLGNVDHWAYLLSVDG